MRYDQKSTHHSWLSTIVYLFFLIMKDFFRSYRSAKIRSYGLPVVFALFLSFWVVSLGNLKDMSSLQANVLSSTNEKTSIPTADLILDRTNSEIVVHMWKNAEAVESLTFTLLGDPIKFTALTSSDPSVTILTNEPGMSLVKVSFPSKNLTAGEVITKLQATIQSGSTLAVTDASFLSQGTSYNLSVQGK